jgi:hypothetical protein
MPLTRNLIPLIKSLITNKAATRANVMSPAQVLTTVNAPYSKQLDAQELVHCPPDPLAAEDNPGHMSSFFGEVHPDLRIKFAHQFNVTDEQLFAAANAFAKFSGQSYPLAK